MKFIPETIGKTISRNSLLLQKASPQVLFVAGIVGVVGGTVLACRATLKVETIVDEAKEKLDMAKNLEHPDYSEADRQRDVSLIYFQSGVKMVRLYAPAIVVGVISIGALTMSYRILRTRNIALMAAYSALNEGFQKYRARVVEKYGDEVDRDLRYGTRKEQITDEETGKKKTVTRVSTDEVPSIYSRFFDDSSAYWERDPGGNFIFLNLQQNYWNDKLKTRGYVFLNEVYEAIGLPMTTPGSVVGWVWSEDGSTDNFIDFGVFEDRERTRDFVNGFEGSILLDFNVDGVIYDKLGE